MEISFDKEADAMYIEFTKGSASSTKVLDKQTVIDLDKKGKIMGIELLSVSKRIPLESLSQISIKNLIQVAA